MNTDRTRRAEAILGMDVAAMRRRTYVFAALAFVIGLCFLIGGQLRHEYKAICWGIAVTEFVAAFLLLGIRLRYLSVVELIQEYNRNRGQAVNNE